MPIQPNPCAKPKRKRLAPDTERARAARMCERHLADLRRAHGRPAADVALKAVAVPLRIAPVPVASFCTSSSELCAEMIR